MAGATPTRPARRSGNALPDGARLGEFELRGVIGEGGFGIVYLAWDHLLQRQVAIKEYMPSTLATRSLTTDVTPRADKFAETFALGLRSFINEAQLLASFDHPALLKVYRFWESNGTAYMVMPFYQGTTLKRALIALNAPPEEGWLMAQLVPLLDALELMHQAHCYHRDIAPDNILLLDEGRPLLLDFGAARRVIGDATQALTAFLKPGYAPVEQYAEMPSMKQGAWTDLYALGSVLHYAIVGHTPPESVARLVNDAMVPLTRAAAGRYSERFLRAIDHALGVRPQDRPQSVAEMRLDLGIAARRTPTRRPGDIPTAPQALDPLHAPQPFDPRPAFNFDDDDATRAPEPATIVALQATPRALPAWAGARTSSAPAATT
jgi:serine/threonine protein kinase